MNENCFLLCRVFQAVLTFCFVILSAYSDDKRSNLTDCLVQYKELDRIYLTMLHCNEEDEQNFWLSQQQNSGGERRFV